MREWRDCGVEVVVCLAEKGSGGEKEVLDIWRWISVGRERNVGWFGLPILEPDFADFIQKNLKF